MTKTFNLAEEVLAPRYEFIARFLVHMTRTKANREFTGGLKVKAKAAGAYAVEMNGVEFVTAKDATSLFEYAFRSRLGYFVKEADTLRVEFHAMRSV